MNKPSRREWECAPSNQEWGKLVSMAEGGKLHRRGGKTHFPPEL
jgi:hypothetical protein